MSSPLPPSPRDFDLSEDDVATLPKLKLRDGRLVRETFDQTGPTATDFAAAAFFAVAVGLLNPFVWMLGSAFGSFTPVCVVAAMLFIGWLAFASTQQRKVERVEDLTPELRSKIESHRRFVKATAEYRSNLPAYVLRSASYWRDMSATGLENQICDLLRRIGYEARTTPASGDEGIDIYATRGRESLAIQCKHWKSACPPSVIRELNGSKLPHQVGWVVCTGGFSSKTRAYAAERGIHLLDMNGILALVSVAWPLESSHLQSPIAITPPDEVRINQNESHCAGGASESV